MGKDQEKSQTPAVPEGVQEIPTSPEIPSHIEKGGVVPVQSQFSATVQDDNGQDLVSTPKTPTVTIEVPASPHQLDEWAKGSPIESLTWFANFWIRLIKKALYFGWKTVFKRKDQ